MRTALLLAYHYPPTGGVAVQRVLRFSRYLSEFGWRPVVVCAKKVGHEPSDPDLVAEIPDEVLVERISCLEPDQFSDSWDNPKEKVVRNLFKLFDRLLFPDDRALWIKPAVRRSLSLIEHHQVELIWATAQPWSTLVAGMQLKKKTGLPLVLDFRDDWTTSNEDFRKVKRLKEEQDLEQEVLKSADAVISVTPHIVEQLKARRPRSLPENRVFYIPNGFDPAHFRGASEETSELEEVSKFTLLHAGGLYDKRPLSPLLEALERWFHMSPERIRQVQVKLAGRIDSKIASEIAAWPHHQIIECLGFISHREIRRLMQSASVNLLMIEQVKTAAWLFTGKVFEYIGARRPILMLGPDPSPLSDILRATGLGHICSYSTPDQTAEVLEQLFQDPVHSITEDQQLEISRYDARVQCQGLAQLFEEVAPR